MRKKLFLVIVICAATAQLYAQQLKIDTVAVSVLDKMSAIIGELGSCSVTVHCNYDVNSKEFGLIKHSDEQQLFLHGPDKLLVRSEGDKGTRQFSYNGSMFTFYNSDKNHYGQFAINGPVMNMIDSVNKLFGIEFPVADFFYPSFVDDIIAEAKNLTFLGMTKVNGKECFHIAGTAKDKTFQFWIANDAYSLPMKMVIIYKDKENSPQYEATMCNWQINPSLPDALFEFTAPLKAKMIKLKAKK